MIEGEGGYLYLLQFVFGGELVDDAFVTQAEASLIRNAINSLTPRESFIIVHRYLNKETLATIASKLPRLRDPEKNKKLPTESHNSIGVTKE